MLPPTGTCAPKGGAWPSIFESLRDLEDVVGIGSGCLDGGIPTVLGKFTHLAGLKKRKGIRT